MFKNNKFMFLGLVGSLVFAVVFSTATAFAQVATYSQINGSTTLKVGSKGADVSTLQKFMASNTDIYPGGLVTGYFGGMTKAAVIQFQIAYDLSADGVAGRITKNKVNSLISAGYGLDIYAPGINNLSVVPSGRNVNISFNSNELVKATVFYDTSAIDFSNWHDTEVSLATPNISGTQNSDSTFSQNKQFTLSNLSANTTYHYMVTATDGSGNTSATWPTTFTTGQ